MKWSLFLVTILMITSIAAYEPHFMYDPAISADGNTVCFCYMGDLWSVPFEGGVATRLTATEGSENSPVYSPDGKWIAYNSNYEGFRASYIIPSDGGLAKRVTTEFAQVADWFPDGKSLLVNHYVMRKGNPFFQVFLDGRRPVEYAGYGDTFAKFTAGGDRIIYSDRGEPFREKYRGSINGDLWSIDVRTKTYTRLTNTELTERYPVCSHQSDTVYFSYSDGEILQIFRAPLDNLDAREQLTHFDTWSARDLDIAHENDRIVYEFFDRIGSYEPATGVAKPIDIEVREQFHDEFIERRDVTNRFDRFAISPNGKLIAFSAYYDLFAVPEKGGEVLQLTHNQAGIDDITVMDDGTTIYYSSYEKGVPRLYRTSVKTPGKTEMIRWSKDRYIESVDHLAGNRLLIRFSESETRDRIAIADSTASKFNIMDEQFINSCSAISPDERYLIYCNVVPEYFTHELHLYDFEEKTDQTLFILNSDISDIFWGTDGKTVFYTRYGDIYRLDIFPKDDYYKEEDHWKSIFEPGPESKDDDEDEDEEKVAVEYELKDIRERQQPIVTRDGFNYVVWVENDSTLYYIDSIDDDNTLRKTDYKGKNDKSIHNFKGEIIDDIGYNEANKKIYLRQGNIATSFDIASSASKPLENKLKYSWDRSDLNRTIFDCVWVEFGRGFYDPAMQGVDWDAAYKLFSPHVDGALTPDMLASVVDEMIGDVNASHTGFYPRRDKEFRQMNPASLGLEFDYSESRSRGIRVRKIYRQSKLYEPFGIREGDILLEIDGVKIDRETSIETLLLDKTGEKIKLVFDTDDGEKEAEIKGLSYWQNYQMAYLNWVDERTELTDELSEGKFAYVHLPEMSWPNYSKFLDDLFVLQIDKDALVLDFRGNRGGWIHDYVLQALTRQPYAQMSIRYFSAKKMNTPYQTWEKPVVLLIDHNSFSDGEIFPHLFKYKKLGKVVGEPTSGSVIGTGHVNFMDGSSMRMPSNGWYSLDDENMEGNGVQPDIYVSPTPEQIIEEDDVQLKRAIEELLKEF